MKELEPHNTTSLRESAFPPDFLEYAGAGTGNTSPLPPLTEVRVGEGGGTSAPVTTPTFGQRIGSAEEELTRLGTNLRQLRLEWERSEIDNLQNRYEVLRRAVQRYSVACAEVDVCLALLQVRADPTGEATGNLRRSVEEQTAASNELRSLARSLPEAGASS